MASVPNRAYPQNEFSEIQTIVQKHYVYGGREVYHGFTASGAIQQYQPVVPCYSYPTSIYYVMGSITEGTRPIGVSDAAYSAGQSVGVIMRGPVTMKTSGSSVSTVGIRVSQCLSGATYTYVADYNPINATGTIASGSIGWVIETGSGGANADVTVFVNPW